MNYEQSREVAINQLRPQSKLAEVLMIAAVDADHMRELAISAAGGYRNCEVTEKKTRYWMPDGSILTVREDGSASHE